MDKDIESKSEKDPLGWWRNARFGLFIHWGLYAVPAGVWQGEDIPGIGEWIMQKAQIPIAEYEKLTSKFNPKKFDADEWVSLAKQAGMKYLVITAKHHDGFAMYKSDVDSFNIVDATPFPRDPMKELAESCRKAKIKLCFYYSQDQDWHEAGATGNTWDFNKGKPSDFQNYLNQKVKPQLRELLSNYGDIGLIWFDTPMSITTRQSKELKDFVHSIQPDCLVSGRVGHGLGDYQSMGDNQIPAGRVEGEWETPATMNDTWGYKKNDRNWKSTQTLLKLLAELASKGVNYLLNVGPTAQGTIPQPSKKRLREIGAWMDRNGEAIYETNSNPFPWDFDWGGVTWKREKMYLLITDWPKSSFTLEGLTNKITKAYLLEDPEIEIPLEEFHKPEEGRHQVTLSLPKKAPNKYVNVVVLEIRGEPQIEERLVQDTRGIVTLPAHLSTIRHSKSSKKLTIDSGGITQNWTNPSERLEWEFLLHQPGKYEVLLSTSRPRRNLRWFGGHIMQVISNKERLETEIVADIPIETPRTEHFTENATIMGELNYSEPGSYSIQVKPKKIEKTDEAPDGVRFSYLQLVPVSS